MHGLDELHVPIAPRLQIMIQRLLDRLVLLGLDVPDDLLPVYGKNL